MNFCRDDLFCVSREIYSISILYLYIPMVCLVDGGLGMIYDISIINIYGMVGLNPISY